THAQAALAQLSGRAAAAVDGAEAAVADDPAILPARRVAGDARVAAAPFARGVDDGLRPPARAVPARGARAASGPAHRQVGGAAVALISPRSDLHARAGSREHRDDTEATEQGHGCWLHGCPGVLAPAQSLRGRASGLGLRASGLGPEWQLDLLLIDAQVAPGHGDRAAGLAQEGDRLGAGVHGRLPQV